MAKWSMVVKVTCLAMMCMVWGIPFAEGISCGQLQLTVVPCLDYLRWPRPSVPAPCCNAVRFINKQGTTISARQGVCNCLKTTVLSLPGLNLPAVASLPAKCGVNLPYKVSPSIDCRKIN